MMGEEEEEGEPLAKLGQRANKWARPNGDSPSQDETARAKI
jgi:hypothetical protein